MNFVLKMLILLVIFGNGLQTEGNISPGGVWLSTFSGYKASPPGHRKAISLEETLILKVDIQVFQRWFWNVQILRIGSRKAQNGSILVWKGYSFYSAYLKLELIIQSFQ